MNLIYYRCPGCGQIYYSAADLEGDKLICERCGSTVVPITVKEFKEFLERKKKSSNEEQIPSD